MIFSSISSHSKKCLDHERNKTNKGNDEDLVMEGEDETGQADDGEGDRGQTAAASKLVITHAPLFSTDRSFVVVVGHLRHVQHFLQTTEEGRRLGQRRIVQRLDRSFAHL